MSPLQGLKSLYARSRRLPVRTRIAIVSATLTAVILICFAAVVGRLVADRLHSDFERELRSNATTLANAIATGQPVEGSLDEFALGDAEIRVLGEDGQPLPGTSQGLPLGPPNTEEVVPVGPLQVATARIYVVTPDLLAPTSPFYVQYARPESAVDETIGRLWLFLGAGVLVGTLLAGLAGMAVANRAMRPIANLTTAARDIAATRDPSLRIPEPASDDEVAELARTLDQMLRGLDAARAETETAMRREREFVADASHELRTPLTSILANLELLEHSLAGGDEDDAAAVGSALRSSKRMNRLVADLLLLARADAGRPGTRIECDLATIAAEALEEVTPVADSHRLTADLDGSMPLVGNPDELHRMVLNLLENAIRHTPAGTEVELGLDQRDGEALLTVSDDGPGLPEGMESQVFERFVRGEGPADRSARNGTGTGLGLSIVRAVAVSHGGDVTAASAGAGGARFEVRIPLATGTTAA
ncbi:MAG TPA: HAMP domain-containing sensor histidine kinase [Solirubrobacterales bacterium]|nr:HAMP domain-containing sensor histidine kinase [Solirubrobacterales bacterium]